MENIQENDNVAYSDLQFLDDMAHANYQKNNDEGDPIYPPHHLYALLKAKPYFMRDALVTWSNKRHKFN